MENTLRSADFEAEFYPVFQPIVDISSGRTVAFECLARWNSPVLGEVSPGTFIPVAERSGIIARLTPVMLRKALAVAAGWCEDIRLSFNLSALDISSVERTHEIARIIGDSLIHPTRIDLELTETALTDSIDVAHDNMELLRAMGISISLDDFGTGYSTLSHMHHLPLDKIKVDRSFVTGITTNPTNEKIVRSIQALCSDVGWTCVIEGVESHDQLSLLRQLDCRLVQGYVVAKPLAVEDIDAFLTRTAARHEETKRWHPRPARAERERRLAGEGYGRPSMNEVIDLAIWEVDDPAPGALQEGESSGSGDEARGHPSDAPGQPWKGSSRQEPSGQSCKAPAPHYATLDG